MDLNVVIKDEIKWYNEALNSFAKHEGFMSLVENSLNEGEGDIEKRNDVLNKIKNNQYSNDPKEFYEAMRKSKHDKMLTDYSIGDLSQMKLFKIEGYNIGFALKEKDGRHSELVAVFNNEPEIKKIGPELIQDAINKGACYLDHYDVPQLTNLYQRMGFEEYDRYDFDPKYDPDGSFEKKYGRADVVLRKHRNC